MHHYPWPRILHASHGVGNGGAWRGSASWRGSACLELAEVGGGRPLMGWFPFPIQPIKGRGGGGWSHSSSPSSSSYLLLLLVMLEKRAWGRAPGSTLKLSLDLGGGLGRRGNNAGSCDPGVLAAGPPVALTSVGGDATNTMSRLEMGTACGSRSFPILLPFAASGEEPYERLDANGGEFVMRSIL